MSKVKNDNSYIENMIQLIKIIHTKRVDAGYVTKKMHMSHATFYRYLDIAREKLKMTIEFINDDDGRGYKIFDYGIFSEYRL